MLLVAQGVAIYSFFYTRSLVRSSAAMIAALTALLVSHFRTHIVMVECETKLLLPPYLERHLYLPINCDAEQNNLFPFPRARIAQRSRFKGDILRLPNCTRVDCSCSHTLREREGKVPYRKLG